MGATVKVKKIDVVTGKETVYESIRIAAARNNTAARNISDCIGGRSNTCAGYKWERIKEETK